MQTSLAERPYVSRMTRWNTDSSVRALALHEFEPQPDVHMFSRDLIPVLEHEAVKAGGEEIARSIEVQKLLAYLEFTEHLERRLIVPICISMANPEAHMPLTLPDELQQDASLIVIDEAHHAECASRLVLQIVNRTEWVRQGRQEPPVVKFLCQEVADLDPQRAALAKLTFATASETLITGTLMRVPHDPRVHRVVRQVITDHARDERAHHACFAAFAGVMWQQLDANMRDFVGQMFAKSVEAFLSPDKVAEQNWLVATCRFSPDEARRIVHETHEALGMGALREAAQPTLHVLKTCGVLECQAAVDAFAVRGLI